MFTVFFTCFNSLLFTSACILHSQALSLVWLNSELATHQSHSSLIQHDPALWGAFCEGVWHPTAYNQAFSYSHLLCTGWMTYTVCYWTFPGRQRCSVRKKGQCRKHSCQINDFLCKRTSDFTPDPSVYALSFSYWKLPELYTTFLFFLDTVSLDMRWQ